MSALATKLREYWQPAARSAACTHTSSPPCARAGAQPIRQAPSPLQTWASFALGDAGGARPRLRASASKAQRAPTLHTPATPARARGVATDANSSSVAPRCSSDSPSLCITCLFKWHFQSTKGQALAAAALRDQCAPRWACPTAAAAAHCPTRRPLGGDQPISATAFVRPLPRVHQLRSATMNTQDVRVVAAKAPAGERAPESAN